MTIRIHSTICEATPLLGNQQHSEHIPTDTDYYLIVREN